MKKTKPQDILSINLLIIFTNVDKNNRLIEFDRINKASGSLQVINKQIIAKKLNKVIFIIIKIISRELVANIIIINKFIKKYIQ